MTKKQNQGRMTKKQIQSTINKAVYMYAESLGYSMHDDNDGSYVTFSKDDETKADDTIDYSRSYHQTCVLNWASEQTKANAKLIDEFAQTQIHNLQNMLSFTHDDCYRFTFATEQAYRDGRYHAGVFDIVRMVVEQSNGNTLDFPAKNREAYNRSLYEIAQNGNRLVKVYQAQHCEEREYC